MKLIPILLIAIAAASSGWYFANRSTSEKQVPLSVVQEYNKWRTQYKKLYGSPAEMQFRLRVFGDRLKMVQDANAEYEEQVRLNGDAPLSGPMYSLKRFSDLTEEEFKKKYAGSDRTKSNNPSFVEVTEFDDSLLSKSAESAQKSLGQARGFQIKVRDQGDCGSCWAFSAVATAEKKYFDQSSQQIDLSQQELVDCSKTDAGCDGGWSYDTYTYIKKNGISAAKDYPYAEYQSYCRNTKVPRIKFDASFIPMEHVFSVETAKKVMSLGIVAGTNVYSSGKFSHISATPDIYDANYGKECSKQVDHAINIVAAGEGYVTVLNSWGLDWGNKGMKKIKPCPQKGSLLGTESTISHVNGKI